MTVKHRKADHGKWRGAERRGIIPIWRIGKGLKQNTSAGQVRANVRYGDNPSTWITSEWATIRELSGRLHFLSVGRYAVKVRPLLVDNMRFRLVNKPGCQHEKIGASVPLTTIIGV